MARAKLVEVSVCVLVATMKSLSKPRTAPKSACVLIRQEWMGRTYRGPAKSVISLRPRVLAGTWDIVLPPASMTARRRGRMGTDASMAAPCRKKQPQLPGGALAAVVLYRRPTWSPLLSACAWAPRQCECDKGEDSFHCVRSSSSGMEWVSVSLRTPVVVAVRVQV